MNEVNNPSVTGGNHNEKVGGESSEEPASRRRGASERREYIVRHIRSRGILAYDRLVKKFGEKAVAPALAKDLAEINRYGFAIQKVGERRGLFLVDAGSIHLFTQHHRGLINICGKVRNGMAAVSVIFGVPDRVLDEEFPKADDKSGDSQDKRLAKNNAGEFVDENGPRYALLKRNPELRDFLTQAEIKSQLQADGQPCSNRPDSALMKMQELWNSPTICLYVDAGTTNDRLADCLVDVALPTVFSKTLGVRLVTNSRTIFEMLGQPEHPIQVVIVGGSQIGMSEAIAGDIASRFIESTGDLLDISIAFIGATEVDLNRGLCLSDSQEEKTLKMKALARAKLKILNVDFAKFKRDTLRDAYAFARIHPNQIDLVITSPPEKPRADENGIVERDSQREYDRMMTQFEDGVAEIQKRGVPVLSYDRDLLPVRLDAVSRGSEVRHQISYSDRERLLQNLCLPDDAEANRYIGLFLNALLKDFLSKGSNATEIRQYLIDSKSNLSADVAGVIKEFRGFLQDTSLRENYPDASRTEDD